MLLYVCTFLALATHASALYEDAYYVDLYPEDEFDVTYYIDTMVYYAEPTEEPSTEPSTDVGMTEATSAPDTTVPGVVTDSPTLPPTTANVDTVTDAATSVSTPVEDTTSVVDASDTTSDVVIPVTTDLLTTVVMETTTNSTDVEDDDGDSPFDNLTDREVVAALGAVMIILIGLAGLCCICCICPMLLVALFVAKSGGKDAALEQYNQAISKRKTVQQV